MKEVAKVIGNIVPNIVNALEALPRLNDKFHVAETDFTPYYGLIEQDEICQKHQQMLNDGRHKLFVICFEVLTYYV